MNHSIQILKEIQPDPSYCKKGHVRTSKNTYYHPKQGRACKICQAASVNAYYWRRKAKKEAA